MSKLHKTKEWEERIPAGARYEHFFYNSKGEVTKVIGFLLAKKKIAGTNKVVDTALKVHWDGFGKCYIKQDKRKRGYDVFFADKEA